MDRSRFVIAAACLFFMHQGSPAGAETPVSGWSDPGGDIALANADLLSGSAAVSNGTVDLRLRFAAPPFPTGYSNSIGMCFDTDLNPGTGNACGGACGFSSGAGSDKGGNLSGGPGALDTGNFSTSGGLGLDPCCQGWFDRDSNTLRLLIPLSSLADDGDFHYAIHSVASGGVGQDCAPPSMDFAIPAGYWTSEFGEAAPFEGAPLCGMMVSPLKINFGAVYGAGNPAGKTFTILNSRSGALTWTASEDIPWLSLSRIGGASPTTVAASVDATGLTPGTYTGVTTIETFSTCPGPQHVDLRMSLTVLEPPGKGPCPAGLAGKLVTGQDSITHAQRFGLYESIGLHSLDPGENFALEFNVIPFGSSTTTVSLDEIGGRTGFSLSFSNGLVNGSVPYSLTAWNTVRAVFDIASKQYTFSVNGATSAVIPFTHADSSSVQALRINSSSASQQSQAWIDQIEITRSSPDGSSVLYRETFDDGTIHTANPGSITSEIPPIMSLTQACSEAPLRLTVTADKNHLAWSTPDVTTTYDVMMSRVPGLLGGDFSAFNAVVCDHSPQRLDIAPQGTTPPGSIDHWLVRKIVQGSPGTWDEGGNQDHPRNLPPCVSP